MDSQDFRPILQYIEQNYHTATLAGLATRFHYSEPYLCTLITQLSGHSFTCLVKQLRLAEAVHYLESSELRIAEIAERVGYRSPNQFSRVFRQAYQVSPAEFRRQRRAPK